MTGTTVVRGAGVVLVAAAVAGADVAWVPGLIQGWLLPALGGTATNVAAVETLFAGIVFGVLIAAASIGGAIERRNPFAAGRHPAAMAAAGVAVGIAGVSVAVGYARLAGTLVPGTGAAPGVPLLLLGTLAVAIQVVGEEVFFRGWVQPALVARWGLAAGVVATAILFGALHVLGGARAPLSLLNLLLGGLVFGLLAVHGRGLAGAAMLHFGWNATEQLVWGLDPNPGVGGFGAIADRDLVGPALWGGSGEGLNASLGMSFALLAILVPLLLIVRRPAAGSVSPPSIATG